MPKPLIPAGVEHPSIGRFLKNVIRSGLLDRHGLREALRSLSPDRRSDPEGVADHLIKTGKLSRFQASKLLQGAAFGMVLGPYQVLAPIGKGGQSTVYLARDQRSQLLLALKILPPKRALEEDRRLARFRREMELCQRVAHPHLARTQDVGVFHGVYYIAMEFIPGQSLYRLVGDQGPLSISRAARLFAEAAAGLDHAHHQGLIHRDLKPSNILVTPNDHAKVLDLGLALIQGEDPGDRTVIGGRGYVVGTMDYLAPEQADDATGVDPRADIYGLGCTLYFALTGRPPFPGGTSRQKIARHRTEEPVPVGQLNPAVPPAFAAVVHRMMAKRPDLRFPSAAALREELLRWTTAEPSLPLDQAGDVGYRQAMAAIADDDFWAELVTDPVPVVTPRMLRRRGRPWLVGLRTAAAQAPAADAPWTSSVPIALAVIAILSLLAIGLCYVLLG